MIEKRKIFIITLPLQDISLNLKLEKIERALNEKKLILISLDEQPPFISQNHLRVVGRSILFSRKPWKWFRKIRIIPLLESRPRYSNLFDELNERYNLIDYIIQIMARRKKEAVEKFEQRFNNRFQSLSFENQINFQERLILFFNNYKVSKEKEATFNFIEEICKLLLEIAPFDFWAITIKEIEDEIRQENLEFFHTSLNW